MELNKKNNNKAESDKLSKNKVKYLIEKEKNILLEGFNLIEENRVKDFKKYIKNNKSYINKKNDYDLTLLGYASLFLNLEIIDILLKNDADLTIKVNNQLILEVLFKQLSNTDKLDIFVNYFQKYFSEHKYDEFNNMVCIYDNLSRLIKEKKYYVIENLLSVINIKKFPYVFSNNDKKVYNHFPLTILGFINNDKIFVQILEKLNFDIFVKNKKNNDIVDLLKKYRIKSNAGKDKIINPEEWIKYLESLRT